MSTAAPVISIPIDDSGFSRFVTNFNEYREGLSHSISAWAQLNQQASMQRNTFSQQLALQQRQHEHERQMLDAQQSLSRETERTATSWDKIAKRAKEMDAHLLSVTRSILSWGSLAAAGGGLLGFGGLFGLSSMAHGVANDRRTAMGLGVSIGELSSFRNSFSRLIDPDSYLGWMNEMETDITKQGPAFSLLGQRGLSHNTAQDSIDMLKAIRNLAKATPLEQLGPILQAWGQNLSTEEQRRLHGDVNHGGMSDAEFGQLLANFEKQKKAGDIADKTAKAWADLTLQLGNAKQSIFATFVEGPGRLDDPRVWRRARDDRPRNEPYRLDV
jgi:hypothetical protein